MSRLLNIALSLSCAATLLFGNIVAVCAEDKAWRDKKVDRSPVDVALLSGDQWGATANQTSHTVSLVALKSQRVAAEMEVGKHPVAVIASHKEPRIYVSCRDSGEVWALDVVGEELAVARTYKVGFHPWGLALSPDASLLYVAQNAADQIAVLDLKSGEIPHVIACGRWPRHLALSPDGKRLAISASGERGMSIVDCETKKLAWHQAFAGLNIGHVAMSADGRHAYFPWMVYRSNPITEGNIKLGWVLASRIGRIDVTTETRREAFSLDPPGRAIADVHGMALTANDERLVVSAAGTHELLIYRTAGLPFKDAGSTDHIEPELLADRERFTRIALGGRPLGLRVASDNRTAVVANYLRNSLQLVDLDERKVTAEIGLGSAAEVSLARQGEAIFYDAGRSLDQWYSCHTCHFEGGISSERMDTLNDGTRNTPKTVLPLYHFARTGPWTWHGWQKDPRAAMRKSLTETMLGPPPTGDDIDALLAFLDSLRPPPNPFRRADGSLSEAAQQGEKVFRSDKAGCAHCHSGEYFTDGEIHDVGLGARGDAYRGFNTPSLLGVYFKARLLHDGRARSLEELLTGPHNPAKVTGQGELTDEQRRNLIEYLKSL